MKFDIDFTTYEHSEYSNLAYSMYSVCKQLKLDYSGCPNNGMEHTLIIRGVSKLTLLEVFNKIIDNLTFKKKELTTSQKAHNVMCKYNKSLKPFSFTKEPQTFKEKLDCFTKNNKTAFLEFHKKLNNLEKLPIKRGKTIFLGPLKRRVLCNLKNLL